MHSLSYMPTLSCFENISKGLITYNTKILALNPKSFCAVITFIGGLSFLLGILSEMKYSILGVKPQRDYS